MALAGILLAILLGLLVARTALVPLNDLTDAVEDLAETTDVSAPPRRRGARRAGPAPPRPSTGCWTPWRSSRRAQRQLVLDASHELRTPLTSLRTNLEVVRRVDELSQADRSVLVDDVLIQLQELTDLVGDLAELARGDQRPAASRATAARPPGRRRGRGGRHPRAVAQGVSFDLDAETCWVEAGADRLARAVGNLLDNALKWSPPGGVVAVHVPGGDGGRA